MHTELCPGVITILEEGLTKQGASKQLPEIVISMCKVDVVLHAQAENGAYKAMLAVTHLLGLHRRPTEQYAHRKTQSPKVVIRIVLLQFAWCNYDIPVWSCTVHASYKGDRC